MRKRILIILLLLGSILYLNAQIYTPSGTIKGSSGSNYNVGIGTSSPTDKLDVNGAIRIINSQNGGTGSFASLGYDPSTGETLLLLQGKDASTRGEFHIYLRESDAGNAISAFYVDSDGNVGIGTVNPGSKLHVYGGSITLTGGSSVYPATINLGTETAGHEALEATSGTLLQLNKGSAWSNLAIGGNVGIGTTSPDYKLDVCGTIRATEVKVDLEGNCPDFVFKSDYKLMDLNKLEEFVKTNNHLPEIASEKEMLKNGINMKEFQLKLLQKIEELTLYTIEQNKKIEELKKQNARIKVLEEKIGKLMSLSN